MINYDNLIKYRNEFLRYAFKTCDSFSLVFNTDITYVDGYIDGREKAHIDLKPYLIEQYKAGKPMICNNVHWVSKKTVLNRYRCCKATRELIMAFKGVFDFEQTLDWGEPCDINFYRGEKSWFGSVYHENDAGFYSDGLIICESMTVSDIDFLDGLNLLTVSADKCKDIINSRKNK